MYPGQFHQVRRDIHNVVIPMDFADAKDIEILLERLYAFIQRRIPVRFGLVPTFRSQASIDQAKLVKYLHDTYGLVTLLTYLQEVRSRYSPGF